MKFDLKKVQKELCDFWRDNKDKMHYFLNGKEVFPSNVSSCAFQLNEVDSSEGYNFEVLGLNLRVQIDFLEAPYKANFLIKVIPETNSETQIPEEKVTSIYCNRITLQK